MFLPSFGMRDEFVFYPKNREKKSESDKIIAPSFPAIAPVFDF
jgi:hypothetical protein